MNSQHLEISTQRSSLRSRQSLPRNSTQRDALLTEERLWLKERDAKCPEDRYSGGAPQIACLTEAYKARLSTLQGAGGYAPLLAQVERQRTDICQRFGKKFSQYLEMRSEDAKKNSLPSTYLLATLSGDLSTGVTRAPTIEQFDIGKVVGWAKSQEPPFSIPKKLEEKIKNIIGSPLFDHLKNGDFYSINSILGTANCYQEGVYFQTEHGEAREAPAPRGWSDGYFGERYFGTIDGIPAAFQQEWAGNRVMITPWEKDHFAATCTVDFRFKTRFYSPSPDVTYDGFEKPPYCKGDHCDELKNAMLEFAAKLSANWRSIPNWRTTQIARLTPLQRKIFDATKKDFEKYLEEYKSQIYSPDENGGSEDPNRITKQNPLLLPLLSHGEVYLAIVRNTPMLNVKVWQRTDRSSHEVASSDIFSRPAELESMSFK